MTVFFFLNRSIFKFKYTPGKHYRKSALIINLNFFRVINIGNNSELLTHNELLQSSLVKFITELFQNIFGNGIRHKPAHRSRFVRNFLKISSWFFNNHRCFKQLTSLFKEVKFHCQRNNFNLYCRTYNKKLYQRANKHELQLLPPFQVMMPLRLIW